MVSVMVLSLLFCLHFFAVFEIGDDDLQRRDDFRDFGSCAVDDGGFGVWHYFDGVDEAHLA